jgi:hypothetical protein
MSPESGAGGSEKKREKGRGGEEGGESRKSEKKKKEGQDTMNKNNKPDFARPIKGRVVSAVNRTSGASEATVPTSRDSLHSAAAHRDSGFVSETVSE